MRLRRMAAVAAGRRCAAVFAHHGRGAPSPGRPAAAAARPHRQRAGGPLRRRLRRRSPRPHAPPHRDRRPGLARRAGRPARPALLSFDPRGQGEAVEVLGDLATATRVAILVPGSDTSLATFDSRGTASPAAAPRPWPRRPAGWTPGARLAIIAWLGYRTPAMLSPAVLTSGDAGQGAQRAAAAGDRLAGHGDQVALLCHSYGSVVCGLAAPHLPVTDIAVFGSPGMDASSVRLAAHQRPGVGGPGEPATGSATCRTSSCSGSASAPDPTAPGLRRPPRSAAATRAQRLPAARAASAAQPGLHRARRARRRSPDDRPPAAGSAGLPAPDRRRHAAAPGPHRGRAPRPGHRRGHPRPLAGHRAGADPRPDRRHGCTTPARWPPCPPSPRCRGSSRRSPSSSSSAATRPPAATRGGLPGLAAHAPGPADPPGGGARRRLGAAHHRR